MSVLKPKDLDWLILNRGRARDSRRRANRVFVALMVCVVSSLILNLSWPEAMLFTIPVTVGMAIAVAAAGWTWMRWIYSLEHRFDDVPTPLQMRAYQASPRDFDAARLWAIECHEAHVNGDCPLCGAE